MSYKKLNQTYTKKSIETVPLSNTIPLVIPTEVLRKIQYLCHKISAVEWSGVLFYSVEGSIEKFSEMKLKVEDILPMHKGSQAYTEYEMDESVVAFRMADKKRLKWKYGLIHSHNNMGTFFSGTDMEELEENSEHHNYYLSLIVNNHGSMCAKVAFRGQSSGYKCKSEKGDEWSLTLTDSKEVMFTMDCKIEKEDPEFNLTTEFTERVQHIIDEADKPKTVHYSSYQKTGEWNPITKKWEPYTQKQREENFKNSKNVSPAMGKDKEEKEGVESRSTKKLFPLSDLKALIALGQEAEKGTEVDFARHLVRLGNDSDILKDTLEAALEEVDTTKGLVPTVFAASIVGMYPALYERYWDKYATIDIDFKTFKTITQEVIDILDAYSEIYGFIDEVVGGLERMLQKAEKPIAQA